MLSKGFGILEVVITTFVIGVVAVGAFSLITLTLKSSPDGQRRIIATALANKTMEKIRNLPYDNVGTVGGVPSGPIVQSQQVTRNGSEYTIATDIRYIDDPYDGTAEGNPPDALNTDYKQARVEVSWQSNVSARPVLLITQITPKGIEGGSSLGTLVFQALNAAGAGVAGATVHLSNSEVSPLVDLTTATNNEGRVVIPGLLAASGTYQLTVSKAGHTTEQTYTPAGVFTPDTDHSHLTAIAGQVINKTFSLDAVASLVVQTVDALTSAPIPDVAYRITGTKKIGTDENAQPVYVLDANDTTDSSGSHEYQSMVWDSYAISIDGTVTGYDIEDTSLPLPLVINPGAEETVLMKLAAHTPLSLHVTVLLSSQEPIENASVHVTKSGYDETKQTTVNGQAFFADMPENSEYTITVDAAGYQQSVQQVTVDGTVRTQVTLVAL